MAQIKRRKHIVKKLELLNDAGEIEKTLSVDIVVDDFRNRYPRIMADIGKAQALLAEKGDSDADVIAASQIAIKAVFVLVFGEVQTREFLEYYENRFQEAFSDVIPFITDEIIPEVQKAVQEENNRIQSLMK